MASPTERDRLEQVLIGQSELIFQVHSWLEEEQKRDDILRAVVRSSRSERVVEVRDPDPDRIFSLRTIERLCVKYRLRFLAGGLYRGEIPPQAVQAVRALERRADEPLTSFFILAPASRFQLCDSAVDPLLFIPLGNNAFYLVHKWGRDLGRTRAVLNWPLRRPVHLAVSVLVVAFMLTALVPMRLLSADGATFFTGQRLLFLFWSVMTMGGFTVFGWFAFFGQFSAQAWNSRHFN